MTDDLRINDDRLYASIADLGRIGAYRDDATGLDAVCRLSLSDADREARDLVRLWFNMAGLEVSVDEIGNMYARRGGEDEDLAPVMSGSHIDSVPTAGRFDGVLGVLAALELVRTLNDHGIKTQRPFVAAFFTEEEGCRFGTDMLGSAVATGRIPLEDALGLTDRDGHTVGAELERIGYRGRAEVASVRPHAFVECHIEQGPLLFRGERELGVVTGVQGISWLEVTLTGRPAHAGTTPTSQRRDAGLVAGLLNVELREMAESGDYGRLRGTMGSIDMHPGAVNVIPGRVTATIDLRNPDDAAMNRAERALKTYAADLEDQHGVDVAWRQTARTPSVAFDLSVQDMISEAALGLRLNHERMIAGAGHDAQEWARICKTAMIFVPGEYDGISHNPRELSTPKQCADGANVLLHTVLQLLGEV